MPTLHVSGNSANRAASAIMPESQQIPHPSRSTLPDFGEKEEGRILAEDDLFVIVQDKFPVSGHTLIIARGPVSRFQHLTAQEAARLTNWLNWTVRPSAGDAPTQARRLQYWN